MSISLALKRSYLELANVARKVMVDDLPAQYSVRFEIRRTLREQLPLIGEQALVEEMHQTINLMRTSLVQARWVEDTNSHKITVRPEMLKTDGSISQLHFMTPEEALARLDGSEFESALGCNK